MGRGDDFRLSGSPGPERELDEEIRFHLDHRAAELERAGLSPDEARRRAEEEFGDLDGTRRYCRREDQRRLRRTRLRRLPAAARDELVLAWRALTRRPRRVLGPLAILAVAVALNVLIFTVVRSVLLTPLPFPDPGRVAVIQEITEGYGLSRVSYPVLDAWRQRARSVDPVTSYIDNEVALALEDGAVHIRAAEVTEGFFDLLDHPMLVGRPLPPGAHRPDAPPAAIISEGLWRRSFGASPDILDRSLRLNGRDVPVVGVVRAGAGFPEDVDVWVALEATSPQLLDVAGAKVLVGLARLRPGVSLSAAAGELSGIAATVDGGAKEASVVALSDRLVGDVRTPLILLEGAVLLVLLAACANAGSMLLARGVRRRSELAVRASLGAGARRVAGALLLEGLLLGGAAGLVGLGLAAAALKPALALVPRDLPRVEGIHLDPWIGAFALALAVLTGLVTALAPAVAGARTSPAALLRETSGAAGASPWLRRALEGFVVVQVALAVILTAGAGLLLRSFVATVREDPGFDPSQVTLADVSLPGSAYPDSSSWLAFAHELLTRSADLPGARAVALGRNLPISGSTMTSPLMVEGTTEPTASVQVAMVTAGYFDVLRIPLLTGHGFGDGDREGGPQVLVVDPDVRASDGSPVAVGSRAHSFFGTDDYREVIGVVGAVRHDGLRAAPPPTAYEPFFQKGGARGFSVLVRSDAPAGTVARALRALLRDMDPDLPVDRVTTMGARIRRSIAEPRFFTVVLSLFGAMAVLLALAGCQAGLAHRVAERRREIGLRMALGASHPSVGSLILRRGLLLTGAGAVLGLVVALPSMRLLQSQLYQVSPGDPLTWLLLLTLLFVAAAAASYLPARRAARTDPAEILREG